MIIHTNVAELVTIFPTIST